MKKMSWCLRGLFPLGLGKKNWLSRFPVSIVSTQGVAELRENNLHTAIPSTSLGGTVGGYGTLWAKAANGYLGFWYPVLNQVVCDS